MNFFFSNQIDQIFQKTELKFFAWMVTLLNLVSTLLWKFNSGGSEALTNVCWPIFSFCENFPTPYILTALIISCILTLTLLFLRQYRLAFPLMTFSFLLKLAVYFLNFSYSNNIQALIFLLEIFLFFIPLKAVNLKSIILLYVFWSGLSKLNMNWLSGLELKAYLPDLPIKGIEWIAAFIVIIELVSPFILLSKLKIMFNYAWVALFIYFIGYSYISQDLIHLFPAALIVFVVVCRHAEIRSDREKMYRSYSKPEPSKLWILLSIATFSLLHWLPGLTHPISILKNTPLSLQMRKVPSQCFLRTSILSKSSVISLPQQLISSTGNDFLCLPSKYKNFDDLCKKYQKQDPSIVIKKVFYSKELTEKKYNKQFNITYNCTEGLVNQ